MRNYGCFYTDEIFSSILVDNISANKPDLIVDLGIGKGSLTSAAYKKWENAIFVAADIDLKQIASTKVHLPHIKIIHADGLKNNITKKLELKVGSVDVAICNPPYLKIKTKSAYLSLLKEVGFKNCNTYKHLTSDMIFLAQNLRLLREGGELGIILPDGLLTSHDFKSFRQDLLYSHFVKSVIQLPERIFKGTEARTHILIIKKGKLISELVNLLKANKEGVIEGVITLEPSALVNRMDYDFHKQDVAFLINKTITLEETGAVIKRGQLTHAELKKLNHYYIHTTVLQHGESIKLKFSKNLSILNKAHATKDDILLARVGRGCIGKCSMVKSGKALISDCVYKISVPFKYRAKVWESLNSYEGQNWLKIHAHGVCAKVISKKDLLNFPVQI